MIGCDRCDEWYHFECVGIDIVSNMGLNSFRLLYQILRHLSSYALSAKIKPKSQISNLESLLVPLNSSLWQQLDLVVLIREMLKLLLRSNSPSKTTRLEPQALRSLSIPVPIT